MNLRGSNLEFRYKPLAASFTQCHDDRDRAILRVDEKPCEPLAVNERKIMGYDIVYYQNNVFAEKA